MTTLASDATIADPDNLFVATNVEDALKEIAMALFIGLPFASIDGGKTESVFEKGIDGGESTSTYGTFQHLDSGSSYGH